jgi:hypothetical protein
MPSIRHARGTRAALDARATAGTLKSGEVYLISDEGRIAIGTSSTTYQAFKKEQEAYTPVSSITLDFGAIPKRSKKFTWAADGALVGQNVLVVPSAKMPNGLAIDELEMDPLFVAAYVSAPNLVTAIVRSLDGPIKGRRTFNYLIS